MTYENFETGSKWYFYAPLLKILYLRYTSRPSRVRHYPRKPGTGRDTGPRREVGRTEVLESWGVRPLPQCQVTLVELEECGPRLRTVLRVSDGEWSTHSGRDPGRQDVSWGVIRFQSVGDTGVKDYKTNRRRGRGRTNRTTEKGLSRRE